MRTYRANCRVFHHQESHPNCASGNQSHPRVLHCLFRGGGGGNPGDQPRRSFPAIFIICERYCSNKHTLPGSTVEHLADNASGPSGCLRNRENLPKFQSPTIRRTYSYHWSFPPSHRGAACGWLHCSIRRRCGLRSISPSLVAAPSIRRGATSAADTL
jgi:hypothetical protein